MHVIGMPNFFVLQSSQLCRHRVLAIGSRLEAFLRVQADDVMRSRRFRQERERNRLFLREAAFFCEKGASFRQCSRSLPLARRTRHLFLLVFCAFSRKAVTRLHHR